MIPHSKPLIGDTEAEAAARVVRSGHLAQGSECAALERELADYLSVGCVVVVSSGSAALHLALLSLGMGPGRRIGLPSYVCAALLNAVCQVGAVPCFVDLPESGCNIDPTDPKVDVDALIVPHMFGHAARGIRAAGCPVVEDCAMAIGGSSGGRKLGTIGTVGVFSFYATKVLCSGEGGALCTDDADLAEQVRDLRDYDGRLDDTTRFNYKLTDVQAAIARVQLRSLDGFIRTRREIAAAYDRALSDTRSHPLRFTDEETPYRYVLGHPDRDADGLVAGFREAGIDARKPVFTPLHRLTGKDDDKFPNTTRVHTERVSVPLYPALTTDEIESVSRHLRALP